MTIPERQASAYVYFYHRPNMNLSAGGVKVWDPSGSSEYDCLGYDWNRTQALPAGADMFDFSLDNGLSVHMVEPFTEFRITHRGAFEVDLTSQKAIDPYLFGMNAGLQGWTTETHGFTNGHYDAGPVLPYRGDPVELPDGGIPTELARTMLRDGRLAAAAPPVP